MTTRIARTATASTNETKFTWSAWVKKTKVGAGQTLIYNYLDGNNRGYFQFDSDDRLYYYDKEGGTLGADLTSARKFRDTNCWYHLCLIGDSTDGTQGDRIKVYVNNERVAMTATYPSSSKNLGFKTNTGSNYVSIGLNPDSTSNSFEGTMSHIHYVDGIAYPATTFGETDATTGEWKIKTSPGISTANYGNNGYFILKDGNSVTDQSGNSHNFTVSTGTLTKTEDCPSNVFATYNGAFNASGHTLSRGNTQATVSSSSWIWRPSTLGATTGKYYAEIRVSSAGGGTTIVGITNIDDCTGYAPSDTHFGKSAVNSGTLGFAWYSDDGKIYYPPNASTSVYGTWGASDILMLAMDLDNGAFYIGKNGSWLNSGNPASGASKTGAVRTWTAGTGTWVFADAIANGSVLQWNWGNGIFGQSTAVSSAGTNASGIGIFEYDVPSGYTALSTKGLNL